MRAFSHPTSVPDSQLLSRKHNEFKFLARRHLHLQFALLLQLSSEKERCGLRHELNLAVHSVIGSACDTQDLGEETCLSAPAVIGTTKETNTLSSVSPATARRTRSLSFTGRSTANKDCGFDPRKCLQRSSKLRDALCRGLSFSPSRGARQLAGHLTGRIVTQRHFGIDL